VNLIDTAGGWASWNPMVVFLGYKWRWGY